MWQNITNLVVVGLLVATAVYVTNRLSPHPSAPQVQIVERTIVQERVLPPVKEIREIVKYITNKEVQTKLSNLVVDYNKYRTEPGTIVITNNRIGAGLNGRWWSVEYQVTERDNIAGAIAGSVYGGFYLRRLGRWWGGAVGGAGNGQAMVSGMVGYSF
jgi:hypothetical protein